MQNASSNWPLVDIGALGGLDGQAERGCARVLCDALEQSGFLYVANHGISEHVIDDAYQAAERFFARPEAVKRQYYIGLSRNHRGYVPFSEKGDYGDEAARRYEAFDLALELPADDPDYMAGSLLLGPNVWPVQPGFRQAVYGYYQALSRLSGRITQGLEIGLGLKSGTLSGRMQRSFSQLRLLHYLKPFPDPGRAVNMGAHTDYECFTLIHQRQAGLEVLGGRDAWNAVPPVPGTLVMNVGDMLEALTNGILKATPHRVVNRCRERFSMPYFAAPGPDALIAPLPPFVTAERPSAYNGFRAGDHMTAMLQRDFPYLRRRHGDGARSAYRDGNGSPVNPFEDRIRAARDTAGRGLDHAVA